MLVRCGHVSRAVGVLEYADSIILKNHRIVIRVALYRVQTHALTVAQRTFARQPPFHAVSQRDHAGWGCPRIALFKEFLTSP